MEEDHATAAVSSDSSDSGADGDAAAPEASLPGSTIGLSSGVQRMQAAVQKLTSVQGLGSRENEVTVRMVAQRSRRRFRTKFSELEDREEQRFLSSVLRSLPIMLREAAWIRELHEALEKFKEHGDLRAAMARVSCVMHDLKMITARFCWASVVDPLQADHRLLKEHHDSLKESFKRTRSDYLREVTFLRDQAQRRTDPDSISRQNGSTACCTFYDPVTTLTDEEFQYVTAVVKEKLKMIMNMPGDGSMNLGQLASMKDQALEKEVNVLKKTLMHQMQHNADLQKQVADLQTQLVVSASDAEDVSRRVVAKLERQIEELRSALEASPDKLEVLKLRYERDDLQHAYDAELMERMQLQEQISSSMSDAVKADEAACPPPTEETQVRVEPDKGMRQLLRRGVRRVQLTMKMGGAKSNQRTDSSGKSQSGLKAAGSGLGHASGDTLYNRTAVGEVTACGAGGSDPWPAGGQTLRGNMFKRTARGVVTSVKLKNFTKVAAIPSSPCCAAARAQVAGLNAECQRLQESLSAAQQTITQLIELSPDLTAQAATACTFGAAAAAAECTTSSGRLDHAHGGGAGLADAKRGLKLVGDAAISEKGRDGLPMKLASNGNKQKVPLSPAAGGRRGESPQLPADRAAQADTPASCEEPAPLPQPRPATAESLQPATATGAMVVPHSPLGLREPRGQQSQATTSNSRRRASLPDLGCPVQLEVSGNRTSSELSPTQGFDSEASTSIPKGVRQRRASDGGSPTTLVGELKRGRTHKAVSRAVSSKERQAADTSTFFSFTASSSAQTPSSPRFGTLESEGGGERAGSGGSGSGGGSMNEPPCGADRRTRMTARWSAKLADDSARAGATPRSGRESPRTTPK